MTPRRSFLAGTCLALGGLALGLSLNRPSSGQGVPAPREGRYHVAGVGPDFVVVTDTTDGQTWGRALGGNPHWKPLGTPIQMK